jgi:hypothetical protein
MMVKRDDPVATLPAYRSGIENVAAFFTETVTALVDEHRCEQFEMY